MRRSLPIIAVAIICFLASEAFAQCANGTCSNPSWTQTQPTFPIVYYNPVVSHATYSMPVENVLSPTIIHQPIEFANVSYTVSPSISPSPIVEPLNVSTSTVIQSTQPPIIVEPVVTSQPIVQQPVVIQPIIQAAPVPVNATPIIHSIPVVVPVQAGCPNGNCQRR